jgi:hypothetical protein
MYIICSEPSPGMLSISCRPDGSFVELHHCWETSCHLIFVTRGNKTLTWMLAQYGENSPVMKRKAYQGVERFQSGRQSSTDEDCSGQRTSHLCVQPKTFFTNGIRKFMDQCNECVWNVNNCIGKCVFCTIKQKNEIFLCSLIFLVIYLI